jgi:hypothetical protein
MEFTTTNKGKPMLIYDGYIYTQRSTDGEKSYWRCQDRKCTGAVQTTSNETIIILKVHTHQQNFVKCKYYQIKKKF